MDVNEERNLLIFSLIMLFFLAKRVSGPFSFHEPLSVMLPKYFNEIISEMTK